MRDDGNGKCQNLFRSYWLCALYECDPFEVIEMQQHARIYQKTISW